MKKLIFKEVLQKINEKGRTAFIQIPFSIEKEWGTNNKVKVKADIDGYIHRGLLMPYGKKGVHYLGLRANVMEAMGKFPGDVVGVTIEIDTEERIVNVPAELAKALEKNKKAKEIFDKLSYSHRKEYAEWVASAKKVETIEKRISKAIDSILLKR
jgi:hypothetical protein